jgi:replicative DNA helicase
MDTMTSKSRMVPPSAIPAEESLLGAMMLSGQAAEEALDMLTANDFYKPAHQELFDLMARLHRVGLPIEHSMILSHSGDRAEDSGYTEWLRGLWGATPAISQIAKYANPVLRTAKQREVLWVASGLSEAIYAHDQEPTEAAAEARGKLEMIEFAGHGKSELMQGSELMASPSAPYDWVQPFILERDDRLVVTGGEGSGKTQNVLQWAAMAASGAHWWTTGAVPPVRVMVVDMELGQKRLRRRLDRLGLEADYKSAGWRERLTTYSRPSSFDITTRAGATWLSAMVDESGCDLLVLSPLYRLVGTAKPGDTGGEDVAKRAAFAIDAIRDRVGCALLAEMHAAKGEQGRGRDLRPFGSAVWLRWPEFGYGIVRQPADAINYHPDNRSWLAWRGDRDYREWPSHFTFNLDGSGWPLRAQFEKMPSWAKALIDGNYNGAPSVPLPQPGQFDLDDNRNPGFDQLDGEEF